MYRRSALTKWALLIALFLSAVVTHFLLSNTDQFFVVDQQVLEDPLFHHGSLYWKQKGSSIISYEGAAVHIDNLNHGSDEIKQRVNVDTPAYIRFSLEAGGKDIEPDEKYWSGASATVFLYLGDGSLIRHEKLLTLKNSSVIKPYSNVVYLDKTVDSVAVGLRLLRAKGRFTVRNPELSILAEFPAYQKVRILLFAYWCVVAFLVAGWLIKNLTVRWFAGIGGLGVVILAGVLIPGDYINNLNKGLYELLPPVVADTPQQLLVYFFGGTPSSSPAVAISKFGHFAVFSILGFLVGCSSRKIGLIYGIALITVIALLTEVLQIFMHGRSTSIRDVYIDLAGGLFGLLIGLGSMLLIKNVQTTREL